MRRSMSRCAPARLRDAMSGRVVAYSSKRNASSAGVTGRRESRWDTGLHPLAPGLRPPANRVGTQRPELDTPLNTRPPSERQRRGAEASDPHETFGGASAGETMKKPRHGKSTPDPREPGDKEGEVRELARRLADLDEDALDAQLLVTFREARDNGTVPA